MDHCRALTPPAVLLYYESTRSTCRRNTRLTRVDSSTTSQARRRKTSQTRRRKTSPTRVDSSTTSPTCRRNTIYLRSGSNHRELSLEPRVLQDGFADLLFRKRHRPFQRGPGLLCTVVLRCCPQRCVGRDLDGLEKHRAI